MHEIESLCTEMIQKACKVINNIKIALQYLYKRIGPKIHEDASLAAGPCCFCESLLKDSFASLPNFPFFLFTLYSFFLRLSFSFSLFSAQFCSFRNDNLHQNSVERNFRVRGDEGKKRPYNTGFTTIRRRDTSIPFQVHVTIHLLWSQNYTITSVHHSHITLLEPQKWTPIQTLYKSTDKRPKKQHTRQKY